MSVFVEFRRKAGRVPTSGPLKDGRWLNKTEPPEGEQFEKANMNLCAITWTKRTTVEVAYELPSGKSRESLAKRLPKSANVHSSWWSNRITSDYVPPHSCAWHESGWMVADHSPANQEVEFVRMS